MNDCADGFVCDRRRRLKRPLFGFCVVKDFQGDTGASLVIQRGLKGYLMVESSNQVETKHESKERVAFNLENLCSVMVPKIFKNIANTTKSKTMACPISVARRKQRNHNNHHLVNAPTLQ